MGVRRFTRRQTVVVAAALALVLILLALFPKQSRDAVGKLPGSSPLLTNNLPWRKHGSVPCTADLGWLRSYGLSTTSTIRYAQRDIVAVPAGSPVRPPLTVVDKPLFEFSGVDNGSLSKNAAVIETRCMEPLRLEVARVRPPVVDASHLIFGAQTTMKRLWATVKHMARWLPYTGARLFVIVKEDGKTPAKDGEMRRLQKEFLERGMDVSLIHPVREEDSFAQRYFSLVNVMYGARDEKTKWMVLIDDDTFFPSMRDIVALLAKYDASQQHYIGSLSEEWWAVDHYGLMAFGGAGIFLSLPLAKVIDDNESDCKDHPSTTAGDVTVMECIYRHTTTKLTHVPQLHQVDLHGDTTGFYESGREMLSLHHWKNDHPLDMDKLHLVADICDNCFLQRWQFRDETLLTNGFSISYYPQGHLSGRKAGVLGSGIGGGKAPEKIDLGKTEKTWKDEIDVRHSLGPVRDALEETAKVEYTLLDSMVVELDLDGDRKHSAVRQVYYRKGGEQPDDMDSVIVLNWMTDDTNNRGDEKTHRGGKSFG